MKKIRLLLATFTLFSFSLFGLEPSLTNKDLSTSPAIGASTLNYAVGTRKMINNTSFTAPTNYTVEVKAKILSAAVKGFFLETRNSGRTGIRMAINSNGIDNYGALNYSNETAATSISAVANDAATYHTFRFAVEGTNVHIYRDGVFVTTTTTQSIYNDNLLKDNNGNFESADVSMWNFIRAGQGRTTTTGEFRTGAAALKLTNGDQSTVVSSLTIKGLKPSTTYAFSFYAKYLSKTTNNGNMRYSFKLGNYGGAMGAFAQTNAADVYNNIVGSPTNTMVAASAIWTANGKTFTTGATDSIAILDIIGWNGSNTYVLDDMVLYEMETPTLSAPVGSNLVTNGNFTTDATGWSNGSSPLGAVGWASTNSGQLQIKDATWANSVNATYSVTVNVTPNKAYTLSAKTSQKYAATQSIKLVDGATSVSTSYTATAGLTTYYNNTTPAFTAGPTTTSLSMQFTTKTGHSSPATVVMTLDDVVLQEYATFPSYLSYGKAFQSEAANFDIAYINYDLTGAYAPLDIPLSSGITNSSAIACTTCDVTVASGATLNIDATQTLKSVTVAAGGKLTISAGALTATNGVTLRSTSAGNATFVDTNNDSPQVVSGTVEQYLSSARNWYLSSPIVNATVPSGQTYYSYNEAGSNTGFVSPATSYWVAVPAETTITNPMKGYITQPGASTTKSYNGTFNTGTQSITLTRTNSATKPGFNLVANPYPSYLDWQLVDTTTTANIHSSVWYRTKTTGGAYTFDTYNGGLEVATSNGENTVSKLIPPMQAFWVRVKSGYTSGTLTFTNAMRKHVDVVGNKFKAPALSETKLIRLRVTNGINSDETLLCFNANASSSLDNYDSPKMFNDNNIIPEIFTQAGSEKLVINGMNEIPYDTEIALGFVTGQTADFSISRTEMTNFETGTRILLKDKLNPAIEFELNEGVSYNFSSQPTTATTDRFSLIFRAPSTVNGLNNSEKLNAQVFVNAANQITIIAPEKSYYAIYNAVGQRVTEGILNNKLHTIIPLSIGSKLNTGVYFVQISVNGQSEIQKVVIR